MPRNRVPGLRAMHSAVQNLMLPPLWARAKAFGVRPYYDHWDSRI
jgi:hypothetical protein